MKKKTIFMIIITILVLCIVSAIVYFSIQLFINSQETDSEYFTISQEGTITFKVEYMGGGAYESEVPQDIVIPKKVNGKKVKKIADDMFYKQKYVKNIYFPDTITMTEIPNNAFNSCINLESVNIPENVANQITSIGNNAFANCKNLKTFDIPDSVTSIGDYAFNGCDSLKELYIPNSVTTLGQGALPSYLETINIPQNCFSRDYFYFYGTSSIKNISLSLFSDTWYNNLASGLSLSTTYKIFPNLEKLTLLDAGSEYPLENFGGIIELFINVGAKNLKEVCISKELFNYYGAKSYMVITVSEQNYIINITTYN